MRDGDLLFVHASLSKFGFVQGAEETVIAALLESVGRRGTLAMPAFSFQLNDVPEPVFDVRHTPCWVGRIYETFRTRYAAHRSHHCTHSVCAVGARARELTATHSREPCGATSPFPKLAHWNGKILLLGVSHNCNTTFHAVEEQEGLYYMNFRELPGGHDRRRGGPAAPATDAHPQPPCGATTSTAWTRDSAPRGYSSNARSERRSCVALRPGRCSGMRRKPYGGTPRPC